MKVWVLVGNTESSDKVGPYVWAKYPSEETILEVLRRDWPGEFEAFGADGAINYEISEEEIMEEKP